MLQRILYVYSIELACDCVDLYIVSLWSCGLLYIELACDHVD